MVHMLGSWMCGDYIVLNKQNRVWVHSHLGNSCVSSCLLMCLSHFLWPLTHWIEVKGSNSIVFTVVKYLHISTYTACYLLLCRFSLYIFNSWILIFSLYMAYAYKDLFILRLLLCLRCQRPSFFLPTASQYEVE